MVTAILSVDATIRESILNSQVKMSFAIHCNQVAALPLTIVCVAITKKVKLNFQFIS